MFGIIKHLLSSGDILNVIINFSVFIYFIILTIIYGRFKDDKNSLKIWKLLCLVPFLISIIHIAIFTLGSAFATIFPMYLSIYIPSVLIAFYPLLIKRKLLHKISAIIMFVICLTCSLYSLLPQRVVNYTRYNLKDAYISLCNYLEKNYILNEWKKMDYEALKNDGLALIQEAEETGDINKYYDALNNLANTFHDGHMGLSFYEENDYYYDKLKEFNDYGLSLVTLDDGNTIAIDVDENLDIENGDIILKWNDVPIHDAVDKVILPISEGLAENEKIMKTFYLAGSGGDSVSVTYINSNNAEKTVTLNKLDSEFPRAIKSFNAFNHAGEEEYTSKMLDNHIGYLKIPKEETTPFHDQLSYFTDNHKYAREGFRTDLQKLKEQGMTKLVIDIRNNKGGYDEAATALTSLFTKDKMYAYSLGIKNNEGMQNVFDKYVMGDGEFSDLDILVLTNMRCGSAGDGMVLYLSRLDNVTVAGLTNPSGINQETGGLIFMPKGAVIDFPIGLTLDDEGNPNIDIDDTRESRTPVDIKIPLNKECALKIFHGDDYELEWAVDYLSH